MKRITLIFGLTMIVFAATPNYVGASANSAQHSFSGTYASGVLVTDEESPIIVTNEQLVFNIFNFPKNYDERLEDYDAHVSATYTFENPADYEVTARLVFPFGRQPDYIDNDVFADIIDHYEVKVDDVAVDATIRHTYQSYREFNILKDMDLIHDGFKSDDYYNEDLEIFAYTLKINSSYVPEYNSYQRTIIIDLPTNFSGGVIAQNYQSSKVTDQSKQISLYVTNQVAFTVYFLAEDFPQLEHNIRFVDDSYKANEYTGTVTMLDKRMVDFDELAYRYYDDEGLVSASDYKNAVLDKLNDNFLDRPLNRFTNMTVFDLRYQLLAWYDYDLIIGAHQSVTNEVVAPLFPTISTNYKPPVFDFEYLLSPASTWSSFSDLTIKINTDFFLIESSLTKFSKTDTGYELTLDNLPDKELTFRLSTDANPERTSFFGSGLLFVFIAILLIPVLGMYLLGAITLTIYFIIRASKKRPR